MKYPSPECCTTFWRIRHYTNYKLPILIRHYTNFNPGTELDLLTVFAFYLIARGFLGIFATGASCQHRTLTLLDTWSYPRICMCSYVDTNPKLVSGPFLLYTKFQDTIGYKCFLPLAFLVFLIVPNFHPFHLFLVRLFSKIRLKYYLKSLMRILPIL